MSAPAVEWAHTRQAERNRATKVERLAAAALFLGVVTCELRRSHPDVGLVRAAVLEQTPLVRSASETTWVAVLRAVDEHLEQVTGGQRCTRCGSPVLPVVLPHAPRGLVDPLPHPVGDVVFGPRGPAARIARRVGAGEELADGAERYRDHDRCCPDHPAVRQRLRRPRRCLVCQQALARWVADADPSFVVHVCCEESA